MQISARTRKIKFWWHLILAYTARYRLRIFIFILLTSTVSYAIFKFAPNILRNNVVSIGYVGNYTLETIPTNVLSLATKSLITTDNDVRSVPSLASQWTVADEGKTYIVFLKDNLTWHDNSPVQATDISLAISGVDITALNNKAIQFKLPNPISSFPQALNTPVFKVHTFYGTGDFRIVDISKVNSIVKKITLHPKDEKLPQVEIKFYSTQEQAAEALKIGEIKVLSSTSVKNLTEWPNLNVQKDVSRDEIVTVFYNLSDQKLANRDLRQALGYAINRDSFDGKMANSPISYASWAYNPNSKTYNWDTQKSKDLITKSGLKEKTITLSYVTGLKSVAEEIQKDWEAVGIKTELKEENKIPKNFQALLAVNKVPTDPDQYALWHSTQTSTNITNYVNVKIDKLLEDARVAQKEEDRKALYFDFQKFLTEDEPATFLYNPYKYRVSYKNIAKLLAKLPQI